MSLKIGQLFMAGFDGLHLPEQLKKLLIEESLGGVILFKRNISSPEQLRSLVSEIRAAADRPILVGIDQEGGRVFRLPAPFTQIPPMAVLGDYALRNPDGEQMAFQVAKVMAAELRAIGINVNFAPVLDINSYPKNPIIGDRAFSGDRDLVSKLACAMIRGFSESGVAACGKHFPGHGDTPEDSHKTLPVLPHTWDRLRWMELVPFRAAIAQNIPMLMTAHILYGVIDAANPVSLSKRAIVSLLRDEMKFDGVVITDDLGMGGVTCQCPPDEAAVRALAAGSDMVMICNDLPMVPQALEMCKKALADGELKEANCHKSIDRLNRLAKLYPASPSHDLTRIGAAASRTLIDKIKRAAAEEAA